MRWSQAQFEAWSALQADAIEAFDEVCDPGPEFRLQAKIEAWCKEWGRPCLSFRQSKAAKRMLPAGWPDMSIIVPNGQVLFLELKSKRGRLSNEQKQAALQFMALGHTIHEVRSYKRFLSLLGALNGK